MSTGRGNRIGTLTDDVELLSKKVRALHDDLERALEEAESSDSGDTEANVEEASAEDECVNESANSSDGTAASQAIRTEVAADTTGTGGEHVGWEEVETAGPDGADGVEAVEWTAVETE